MYIALPIGTNNVLIANDVREFMGKVNQKGKPFKDGGQCGKPREGGPVVQLINRKR